MPDMENVERRSLLIVDDEPDARFTMNQMLKPLECRILEASDGVEALEVLGRHSRGIT